MVTMTRTVDWTATRPPDEGLGSRLPARRSASAEAAALKFGERERTDLCPLPGAPLAFIERRDDPRTRRCAMAEAAALKLEEETC